MDPFRPLYLVGPTGSGKSDLAVGLAESLGGEIVNADAFQIYAELSILTARPEKALIERAPHHLYGQLSVVESCDAGRYRELALPVMDEIRHRGKLPIIVGGSGLYIKALTHGLQDVPPSSPEVRQELEQLDDNELGARLQEVDPEAAATIDPRNRRYVQRALEIVLTTGQSWAESRSAWQTDAPELRGIVLVPERQALYERIDRRVPQMFANGAVEEVRRIGEWSSTASKAIGVPEVLRLLQGEFDEVECVAAIQQASRNYAKRQLTWFRRERWLKAFEFDPESFDQSDFLALASQIAED